MKEITVRELKSKIEEEEPFTLLDVREEFEKHIADLDIESKDIPYDELQSRMDELDRKEEIVVMCRSGSTSEKAAKFLEKKGFEDVKNLKGGINEWAKKIDPTLPVY